MYVLNDIDKLRLKKTSMHFFKDQDDLFLGHIMLLLVSKDFTMFIAYPQNVFINVQF